MRRDGIVICEEPPNEHVDAPIPGRDWPAQRAAIRDRVRRVLGPVPADDSPLAVEIGAEPVPEGRQSYTRTHLRLRGDGPDDWITAWVLVPTGLTRPAPAVVCCHPTTGGAGKDIVAGISGAKPGTPPEPSRAYGLELAADWGCITICPDMVHDGERVPSGGRPNDSRAFYERHPEWSIVGKYVQDVRRVVDYLLTRRDVNPQAIGIIGHSLGSHTAIFAAAFDERIRACVSNGGTHCWDEGERFHWCVGETADGGQWEYLRQARAFLENRPVRPPFSFVELTALIAPRPLLIMMTENGVRRQRIGDFLGQVRRTYQALGAGEMLESAMCSGGHGFPLRARLQAYEWLRRNLGR